MKKIEINGKEITVREPKVRDIRAVSHHASEEDKEVHLLANLSGMSVDEIDDLTVSDYKKLQKELHDFLA